MEPIVGCRAGLAHDPERPAWRAAGPRPLRWVVWHPAGPGFGPPGAPWFRMAPVAEDAPLSEARARWPVVLLSHGTGGAPEALSWLGIRLAAQGFVCLAVAHHGNTAREPALPEGYVCWWERSRDLTVLLDQISAAGPLADRLDLDAVGVAGFSLGGHTALSLAGAIAELARFQAWIDAAAPERARGPREFPDLADQFPGMVARSAVLRDSLARQSRSYRDPRVKAVLALAPAPTARAFTPESLAAIDVPVRILCGRGDREAPPAAGALWLRERNPAFALDLLGEAVGHYAFLPEGTELGRAAAPTLCVDPAGVDRAEIHRIAACAAAETFRAAFGAGA